MNFEIKTSEIIGMIYENYRIAQQNGKVSLKEREVFENKKWLSIENEIIFLKKILIVCHQTIVRLKIEQRIAELEEGK